MVYTNTSNVKKIKKGDVTMYVDNLKIKLTTLQALCVSKNTEISFRKGPEDVLFNNTFLERSKVKECVTIIIYKYGIKELKMYGTLEDEFVKINHITNDELSFGSILYNYGWFFKETTGSLYFKNNGTVIKYTDGVHEYIERQKR